VVWKIIYQLAEKQLMKKYFAFLPLVVGVVCLVSCGKTSSTNPVTIIDTVESYKISGNITLASSSGFTGRAGAPSCVVNGKIYVLGGETHGGMVLNTLEVFDPSTNSWSTPVTTGTFTPRKYLTASVVNNKIYALGGFRDVAVNTVEVFDPATNTWTTPPTKGTFTPRWALSSCVVNNKIYVIGGYNGTKAVNILEVFDPSTSIWSTPFQTNLMTPNQFHASVVVDGKIYLLGGNDGFNNLNSVEIFDPKTSTWTTPMIVSQMNMTARYGLTASYLNGNIYTLGGNNGIGSQNTFEVFDPQTNTWGIPNVEGSFVRREYLSSSVVDGKMYITGGYDTGLITTNEVFSLAR
jgi:N-acetylneuraminic acid mutarotase